MFDIALLEITQNMLTCARAVNVPHGCIWACSCERLPEVVVPRSAIVKPEEIVLVAAIER